MRPIAMESQRVYEIYDRAKMRSRLSILGNALLNLFSRLMYTYFRFVQRFLIGRSELNSGI